MYKDLYTSGYLHDIRVRISPDDINKYNIYNIDIIFHYFS